MLDRIYFLIGDLSVNIGTGALVGWGVARVIPPDWGMVSGMLLGMVLGMLITLLLMLPLTILLGALEVMIPTMLAAMLAGMGVGMARAMGHLPPDTEPLVGGGLGLLALLFTWGMQYHLRGERLHG